MSLCFVLFLGLRIILPPHIILLPTANNKRNEHERERGF
jgi:hypothetical protein